MRDEDDQMYIYQLYGTSKPRKIKADHSLRIRIGSSAKITQEQIEDAQREIDFPKQDFSYYAKEQLCRIEDYISLMRETSYDREADYENIIVPLSNIKGQAGMFGNWLASHLSDIILKFLEKYHRLDNSVLAILTNYCKAVRVSYKLELYDMQSSGGQKITYEMQYAINRYIEKFNKKISE